MACIIKNKDYTDKQNLLISKGLSNIEAELLLKDLIESNISEEDLTNIVDNYDVKKLSKSTQYLGVVKQFFSTKLQEVSGLLPLLYSGRRVLENNKRFTVRTKLYNNGQDHSVILSGRKYQVKLLKARTFQQALIETGLSAKQFIDQFIGQEEVQKDYIDNWLQNKEKLAVYSIEEETSYFDVEAQEKIDKEIFESRIATLQNQIKNLKTRLKSISDDSVNAPNRRFLIEQAIKRTEQEVKDFKLGKNRIPDFSITKMLENVTAIREKLDFYKLQSKDTGKIDYKDLVNIIDEINGIKIFLSKFSIGKKDDPTAELTKEEKELKDINDQIEIRLKEYLLEIEFYKQFDINAKIVSALHQSVIENGELKIETDIDAASSLVGSLANSKNALAQFINKQLKTAASLITQSLTSFGNRFRPVKKNFVDFMKKQGFNEDNMFEMFIEDDKDRGYVIKESEEYNQLKKSFDKENLVELAKYLKFLLSNEAITINQEKLDKLIKERLLRIEQEFPSNEHHQKLLDDKIGGNLDVIEINNPEMSKEEVFKLAERNAKKDLIKELQEKESDNLKKQFSQAKINELKSKVLSGSELSDEDLVFLRRLLIPYKATGEKYGNNGNFYHSRKIVTTELDNAYYISEKYAAIMKLDVNDPRRVFYHFFVNEIQELKKKIGYSNFDYLPKNYIPAYPGHSRAAGQSLVDWYKESAKNYLLSQISENAADNFHGIDSNGEPIRDIPLHSLTKMGPALKNYNLVEVLEEFEKEAINYIEKSKVEEDVLSALSVLKNQKMIILDAKGNPRTLSDGSAATLNKDSLEYQRAEYNVAASLYGLSQEKEGVIFDKKIYDPKQQEEIAKLEKRMIGLGIKDDRKAELNEKYGDITKDSDAKLIAEYDALDVSEKNYLKLAKQYKDLTKQHKSITTKKLVNALGIKLPVLQALALSIKGPIAETLQGTFMMLTEAAAGKHITTRGYLKAFGMFLESLRPNTPLNTKITALQSVFGVTGDINGLEENNLQSKLFILYKAAKLSVNTPAMIEFLKNRKIKGVSAFDLITVDKDGNILYNNISKEQVADLQNEFREFLRITRERSHIDPTVSNKTALGRLIGVFKLNWMVDGFNYHWGAENNNKGTGFRTKGIYRSVGNLFMESKEETNILGHKETTTKFSPINGIVRLFLISKAGKFFRKELKDHPLFENVNFDEFEEQNVKRAIREFTLIMAIYLIYLSIAGLRGDDDDDDTASDKAMVFILNMATRDLRDLTTYMDPNSLTSFTKNMIPALNTATGLKRILGSATESAAFGIGHFIPGVSDYTDEWFDPNLYSGTDRETWELPKRVVEFTPIVNQIPRTIKTFENITQYSNY